METASQILFSWGLTITFFVFAEDSDDESDVAEPSEGNEDGEDTFMRSYSDVLNEELKSTTLEKSFVRANDQVAKKDEVYFLSSEHGEYSAEFYSIQASEFPNTCHIVSYFFLFG